MTEGWRPVGNTERDRCGDRVRRGPRASSEPMTESLTVAGSTDDGAMELLSVPANASVDEVVEAVRTWIASAVPRRGSRPAVGRAGRRSRSADPGRVRGVVSRLWAIGPGGCHVAPRLRRARSLAGCARRVEQELAPVQPRAGSTRWGSTWPRPPSSRMGPRTQRRRFPPSDRPERGGLVPALQRAGSRVRPRVAGHQGRARRR